MRSLNILLLVCLAPSIVEPARILFLIPAGPKSHQVFIQPIVSELASRGHKVTILSTDYGITINGHANITHFKNKMKSNALWDDLNRQFLQKNIGKPYKVLQFLLKTFGSVLCEEFLNFGEVQEMMSKGQTFDVAIVTSLLCECGFPIANTIAKSTVFLNFMRIFPHYAHFLNIPIPYSYIPIALSEMSSQMSFFERLKNTAMSISMLLQNVDYGDFDVIVRKKFEDVPRVSDAIRDSALVFTMGDPVVAIPSPKMPHVVEIGGLHCRSPKPLPKQFQEIVDSSGEHGFILFSLGTVVQNASQIPQMAKAFVTAFAQLKQTVIWKSADSIPGVSENVKVVSWTPQQDLLGHPKIRLFITQSGIFGLHEAVYHGVPILGMPFFADQFANIARAVDLGIGMAINYPTTDPAVILSKIKAVLENRSYHESAKKYSIIFRDQMESPLDRAVYWLEYLVRHPGARHLHNPGRELNIFQYFLLDVVGLVLLLVIAVIVIFVFVIKYSYRRCTKSNRYFVKGKTE